MNEAGTAEAILPSEARPDPIASAQLAIESHPRLVHRRYRACAQKLRGVAWARRHSRMRWNFFVHGLF